MSLTIGSRVSLRRKALGFSQEELASRIGTSQRQISKYEKGLNDPTGDVLIHMAQELETTTDYLLGLTDIVERPLRGKGDLKEDELEWLRLYRQAQPDMRHRLVEAMKALAS